MDAFGEQLSGSHPELLRQLATLPDELLQSFGDEAVAQLLDGVVRRHGDRLGATSLPARSRVRGRLYVFGSAGLLSEITAATSNWWRILPASRWKAISCLEARRLDRQLSTGGEIQAQLLPDHCPVIEGSNWPRAVGLL